MENGEAEKEASYWVTNPRTSEHEIGLAVDIVSFDYQTLDEKQETTAVQKWLMEHCTDYGFILRYPTAKKDITKINYEPWHYRYVGIENAKFMKEKDICLEEYIARRDGPFWQFFNVSFRSPFKPGTSGEFLGNLK